MRPQTWCTTRLPRPSASRHRGRRRGCSRPLSSRQAGAGHARGSGGARSQRPFRAGCRSGRRSGYPSPLAGRSG
ncbi:hypothetical protein ACFPRL_34760 [Pseudoclavibacter helvolus]